MADEQKPIYYRDEFLQRLPDLFIAMTVIDLDERQRDVLSMTIASLFNLTKKEEQEIHEKVKKRFEESGQVTLVQKAKNLQRKEKEERERKLKGDVFTATPKTEERRKTKVCPACKGSGFYGRFGDCSECHGLGLVDIDYVDKNYSE